MTNPNRDGGPAIDNTDLVKRPFNCCLNTPEPGPWTAGVDDSASDEMVATMNGIRDNLSYRTPVLDFIKQLQAAIQIDNRTLLGRDIQRCLLDNAAHRLKLLVAEIPRLNAALTTANEMNIRLVEALRPFSQTGKQHQSNATRVEIIACDADGESWFMSDVKLGDLRTAARLVAEAENMI